MQKNVLPSNIPSGLLPFTLLHESVFTGAVALAALPISSVVINQDRNDGQIYPNAAVHITACVSCYSTCWWTCHVRLTLSSLHFSIYKKYTKLK